MHVGFDVGKQYVLTVARWGDGSFERPWLVNSPGEIGVLVDLLASVARQPALRLAMEPTETYGDVLRQALGDAGLPLEQVSAKAVGVATACVLWVHLGDPSAYHCPQAYRKAMGLNLKECSSGIYPGQVKITQRAFGQVRRWLYFAALRLIRQGPVARWYQRKKARDGEKAKRAVIGVMRRLALALHAVGADGEEFHPGRLFPRRRPAVRRGGGKREASRR